jgi:hypothetical protein
MPTREEVVKAYGEASNQLSTQCRTLSLGILALSWAMLTSKDSPLREGAKSLSPALKWNLVGIEAAVILVLAIDAWHYVLALHVEDKARTKIGDNPTVMYDKDVWYVLAKRAFWSKLIALGATAIWFVIVLSIWLFHH